MSDYAELVKALRHYATIEYDKETGSCYAHWASVTLQAADAIEELRYALLLMVLQYCTTDDGLLCHSFMTAGECAFSVLGLENGQHEAPLWEKIDREMQEESERAAAKTAKKEET